jgi:hypothetical protein
LSVFVGCASGAGGAGGGGGAPPQDKVQWQAHMNTVMDFRFI